jgi:hypothetical protein
MPRLPLLTNVFSDNHITFILAIATLSLVPSAYALNISGDIGGSTLTAEQGPYLVEEDCVVPKGKSTVIAEGCQFFFEPFTGIIVNGNLTVAGTQEKPVLFTSIKDTLEPKGDDNKPDAFDWNGILISKESGTVVLKHFKLNFSVYGIKSQNSTIKIDNGLFRQNGQFDFAINDKIQTANDTTPYFYSVLTVTYLPNHATSGQAPVDWSRFSSGDSVKVADKGNLKKNNHEFSGWNTSADGSGKFYQPESFFIMGDSSLTLHAQWRRSQGNTKDELVKKGVPAGISIAGAAGGIVSVYYLNRWLETGDEYRVESDPVKRSDLREEGKRTSAISISACAGSVAAFGAAATLYWWWNMHNNGKLAAVIPFATPGGAGIALSFELR